MASHPESWEIPGCPEEGWRPAHGYGESPTDAPPAARTSSSPHEESPISDLDVSGSNTARSSRGNQSPEPRAISSNDPPWMKETRGDVVFRVEPGRPSCRCQLACAPLVAAQKGGGIVAAGGGGGGKVVIMIFVSLPSSTFVEIMFGTSLSPSTSTSRHTQFGSPN